MIKKILIFHIGSLGDTLVSVPAFWVIRKHFRAAKLTLLSDNQVGNDYVRPQDVLEGSDLVDDYMSYPVDMSRAGKLLQPLRMMRLLLELRVCRFDALIYLIRTKGREPRIARDVRFFRLAGIRRFIGTEGFMTYPEKKSGCPLPIVSQVGDQCLEKLGRSGMAVQLAGKGCADLVIGEAETVAVGSWLAKLPGDKNRKWVGIGIGGKEEVNIWPLERYREVGYRLIHDFDVWPVIFGGAETRSSGEVLIAQWGRGYVAAGALNVRQSIAALGKCTLFVGNDTGTIHMAAAAGVRCVGIYSSHNYPGEWYPYGNRHTVLRTQIECEGCELEKCEDKRMKCIMSIDVEQVYNACEKILREIGA